MADGVCKPNIRLWFLQHWGWVVTACAFFINVALYNVLYCYSILLVHFQKEFGTNTFTTGWVGSLGIALSCWSSIIANPLIDRFGNRVVTIVGTFLSFFALMITSFMPELSAMYFTYSVMYGLGAGFTLMSSVNLVLQYFPHRNSTRAVSILMAGANIGMLSMGPFIHFLIKTIAWQNTLRVMGALMMVVGIPLSFVYVPPQSNILMCTIAEDRSPSNEDVEDVKGNGEIHTKERFPPDAAMNKERFPPDAAMNKHCSNELIGSETIDSNKCTLQENPCGIYRQHLSEEHNVEAPPSNGDTPIDAMNGEASRKQPPLCDVHSMRNRHSEQPHDESKGEKIVALDAMDDEKANIDNDGGLQIRQPQARPSLLWRILVALTYPDLWLFCVASLGYGSCASFFYVHLVCYIESKGFTEENGTQAIVAIGFSTLAGKFLLSSVADLVPFPKIFLFLVATFTGIALTLGLLFVANMVQVLSIIVIMGLMVLSICDTLPYSVCNQIFGVERGLETWTLVTCFHGTGYLLGSVFGKSVDLTGSYNGALWATITIYAVSGIFCIFVPVYQRLFARERFLMMSAYKGRLCCYDDVEDIDHREVVKTGINRGVMDEHKEAKVIEGKEEVRNRCKMDEADPNENYELVEKLSCV